jgi:peptidoglycan/LPS O-acetylase OafA/YrhL
LLKIQKQKHRIDLQILRGIAVFAVVLFHAFEDIFPLGYLGVDVFFVISGYVVTPLILRSITNRNNFGDKISGIASFYIRRFWRLGPALSATLIISAVFIFFLGPLSDQRRFASQGLATQLLAGNLGAYKFAGSYFFPYQNPLIHTWSLSIEEQYYLLTPLLALIFLRKNKSIRKKSVILLTVTSFLSFAAFSFPGLIQQVYSLVGFARATEFSFYSPFERVWQFGLGGLCVLLFTSDGGNKTLRNTIFKITTMIALVFVLFTQIEFHPRLGSVFASTITAAVIVLNSLDYLPNRVKIVFIWLGDRSYSIYLVHMPLLYIATYSPFTKIKNVDGQVIQICLALILTLVLGSVSYKQIESRFRQDSQNISFQRNHRNLLVGIVMVFLFPLMLFSGILVADRSNYWGFNRNIQPPVVAWEVDENCRRMSRQDAPCMYKSTQPKGTILLIGDSQAAQISQAVIDAGRKQNFDSAIWTQGLCYVQFKRSIQNQVTDECMSQNREILKWAKNNRPTLIIVAQNVRAGVSIQDLKNGLEVLKTASSQILLVENIPQFPDRFEYMKDRPILMDPYTPPKKYSVEDMDMYNLGASDSLAQGALELGLKTINFRSIFCDTEYCKRFSRGTWTYADFGHLSLSGADLLVPQLVNYLKALS